MTPKLAEWQALSENISFSGILIGNGSSRAVWEDFRYKSLYRVACEENETHQLLNSDKEIFDNYDTSNFELILSALSTAQRVGHVLDFDVNLIDTHYNRIRSALVEAVHSTHIPWNLVPHITLESIYSSLRKYSFVYSTNYDLLIYWSIMYSNAQGFVDYFWNLQFDLSDTDVWKAQHTKILFLHGGLHLYKSWDGRSAKRTATQQGNLLEQFGQFLQEGGSPLFVSEGQPEDKLRSISRSDYLSFGYSSLSRHQGPLCIFGHSLGESDKHILDAIRQSHVRDIAVSMYPAEPAEIISKKGEIYNKLPEANLYFYDSTTHPLGDPRLQVAA